MTNLEAVDAALQEFAVSGIARVKIGNEETEMRSLKDILAWRDQLLTNQAVTRPGAGIRLQSIVPNYSK